MIVESGLIHSRGFETRKDGISHCLKGGGGGSSGNFLLDKPAMRIRKLTPLECFRLQSYPDEWYALLKLYRQPELIADIDFNRNDITEQVLLLIGNNGIKEGMSDSQLYKMAGNGVTSLVSWDVARRFETIKQDGVK
jgi:site-specific DNA-cytosine methylase